MRTDLHFSSKSGVWETPQEFFDELDREFHFTLDACANNENAKCARYYTEDQDGLQQPWEGVVWCNPPYGRTVGRWVKKAAECTATVAMLLPARTDTRWFHNYCYQKDNVEIRFVRGRLKFGGAQNAAPFASMVVIFRRKG